MKYEFEIRGNFDAESPPIADAWKHSIIRAVETTMARWDMQGHVEQHQLALDGKLQEDPPGPKMWQPESEEIDWYEEAKDMVLDVNDEELPKFHAVMAIATAQVELVEKLGNIDLNTRLYAKFQRQDESSPFCMGQSDD